MSRIHLLLTADEEHQKGFSKFSIIGFPRMKSLKDILLGAKTPLVKENSGFLRPLRIAL